MPTLGAPRYPARPGNEHALALRREASEAAMRDLCSWMKEVCTEPQALRNADGSPRTVPPADPTFVSGDFGAVAMFDATNTTKERRRWLIERSKETGAKVAAAGRTTAARGPSQPQSRGLRLPMALRSRVAIPSSPLPFAEPGNLYRVDPHGRGGDHKEYPRLQGRRQGLHWHR